MSNISIDPSKKVIADHLRSSCFLIADGVLPSNEGKGYVLRRIIRRAVRHIGKLQTAKKKPQTLMDKLVPALIKEMGESYPELSRAKELIMLTLSNEEEKFGETLEKGLKILAEEIAKIQPNNRALGQFSGVIAFKLYDTYGFPLDLTEDILKEKGLVVDLQEFNNEMEKQKSRSKEHWVGSGEEKEEDLFFQLKEKLGETKFLGYEKNETSAKILAIIQNGREVEEIIDNSLLNEIYDRQNRTAIILDQTPFYATSGGQRGDCGEIIGGENVACVIETKKFAGGLFVHLIAQEILKSNFNNISNSSRKFRVGDQVLVKINQENRQKLANNHSATHLLHKALKEVLDSTISQKGSNVEAEYLTFDYNFNRGLSDAEKIQLENIVNQKIRQNSEIKTQIMSIDQARNIGAEALFGEKYTSQVRVLSMGELTKENSSTKPWSVELCGGTHAKRTGDIGVFKITAEFGIASGIRRIEAKTGAIALLDLNKIDQAKTEEKAQLIEQLKQKDKEIARLKKQILLNDLQKLKAEKVANINFLTQIFEDCEAKELREITNEIKNKANFKDSYIFVFFAIKGEKVALCLAVSSNLLDKFDSNKLIAPAIAAIGGKGGGGKPDLAMGGGVNKNGIAQALKIIKQLIN